MRERDSRPVSGDSLAADALLERALSPGAIARRGFILTSLGFLAACASTGSSTPPARANSPQRLPEGLWTSDGALPPQRWAQPVQPAAAVKDDEVPPAVARALEPKRATVRATDKPAAAAPASAIPKTFDGKVIARTQWTSFRPDPKEMDPLGRPNRITVHHTGNPYAFSESSVAEVKEELRHILTGQQGAGHKDLAYHFVIDPAGRVWAGRDLRYEGRHTRGENDRNIGVMVLGNFELQRPSQAQVITLEKFLKQLQAQHKIKRGSVYTHRELTANLCPGKSLQPHMGKIRSRLA
jgi:N-acetylmuramoyl-L-alanine amidase